FNAELAGVLGERLLVELAARKIEAVQPFGGFALAFGDFLGFGDDGDVAMLGNVDEVARVAVAIDFDAELGGVLPFLDAALASRKIDAMDPLGRPAAARRHCVHPTTAVGAGS